MMGSIQSSKDKPIIPFDLPEDDGLDHLRADVTGTMAAANPNDPGYLKKIDSSITALGHIDKMGKSSQKMAPDSPDSAMPETPDSMSSANAPMTMGAPKKPGVMGRIGHVLAKMGNIAGDVFAPAAMAAIPGTDLNKTLAANRAAKQKLTQEEATSKENLEGAQADEAKARADALRHPPEKTEDEEWSTVPNITGPNGEPIQQEKHSGQMRYGDVTSKPLKTPGSTSEQNKEAFQGVISKIDAAGLPTGPKDIDKSLDAAMKRGIISGAEHATAKAYQSANPTPGTNLTVHIAGAQQAQGFQHTEAQEKDTYKRYETAQDAEQRLSRMEASYQKALKGDQQAMLALLTDHIGMTLGLQKGARITKDILNEATASMPWLEKIESKFDSRGYLSGVTLGPDQMAQMLDLGYEARDRAVQGAHDSSELYGVQPPPGAEKVFGKRKIGDKPALHKSTSGEKEPQRPANVPADYVYQENGPKGKGWYKPSVKP